MAVQKILEVSEKGTSIGFFRETDDDIQRLKHETRKDYRGYRVAKTHVAPSKIVPVKGNEALLIYTLRHPVEVFRSGKRKFNWTEQEAINAIQEGAISYEEVKSAPNSLILRYEDFNEDPRILIEKICVFLEIKLSQSEEMEVAEYLKRPSPLRRGKMMGVLLKRRTLRFLTVLGLHKIARKLGVGHHARQRVVNYLNSVDPKTQLHSDHITSSSMPGFEERAIIERLLVDNSIKLSQLGY